MKSIRTLMKRILRKSIWPFHNAIQVALYERGTSQVFMYYQSLKLLYIGIPKNANSAINRLLLLREGISFEEKKYGSIHVAKSKFGVTKKEAVRLLERDPEVECLAFVRNPFERIVSCYINKVQDEDYPGILEAYWGFFFKGMSFALFTRRVRLIPDSLSDIHFRSQCAFLYGSGKKLYTYLGHIENIETDIVPIADKYSLSKLRFVNRSKAYDWRAFYTPESAHIVYERYRSDFELLGYKNEYTKLLEYLEGKG